jgi:hypothetical protein
VEVGSYDEIGYLSSAAIRMSILTVTEQEQVMYVSAGTPLILTFPTVLLPEFWIRVTVEGDKTVTTDYSVCKNKNVKLSP